jgi:hypothetical protein
VKFINGRRIHERHSMVQKIRIEGDRFLCESVWPQIRLEFVCDPGRDTAHCPLSRKCFPLQTPITVHALLYPSRTGS